MVAQSYKRTGRCCPQIARRKRRRPRIRMPDTVDRMTIESPAASSPPPFVPIAGQPVAEPARIASSAGLLETTMTMALSPMMFAGQAVQSQVPNGIFPGPTIGLHLGDIWKNTALDQLVSLPWRGPGGRSVRTGNVDRQQPRASVCASELRADRQSNRSELAFRRGRGDRLSHLDRRRSGRGAFRFHSRVCR